MWKLSDFIFLHSSILAWRIPWTEEPGGLQFTGSQNQTWQSDSHFHIRQVLAQVARAEGSLPMSLAIGEGVLVSLCVPPSGSWTFYACDIRFSCACSLYTSSNWDLFPQPPRNIEKKKEAAPDRSVGKESTCNAGDPCLIAGSGRSSGGGIGYPLQYSWASLVAQLVKNLPAMRETWVWSLDWEDPLEKGKATHSSILAWRIPWTV